MKKTKWQGIGLTEKEIENKHDSYYVYLHIFIPTNEVIYVGKGNRRRAVSFNRRKYYDEYLKGNIEVDIIYRTDDESEALKQEEMEIFYFRYIGMAKYNGDEFYSGKRRGEIEEMNEIAMGTEVCEEMEEYTYHNEFESNVDIKFENVQLNVMELGMIRNSEYRSNVENFIGNLESLDYDEIRSMYDLCKQILEDGREDDMNLIHAYRIICKHLKKYF